MINFLTMWLVPKGIAIRLVTTRNFAILNDNIKVFLIIFFDLVMWLLN
jgi:hypothetical protein